MNTFSVWLVPQKEDKEYLDKVIRELAQKYDSPIFIPHITLFVDVKIEEDRLKSATEEIFSGIKPFVVRKKDLNQSDNFFKTVFIEFEQNEIFKKLYDEFSIQVEQRDFSLFKPHLSLIYKDTNEDERLNIIKGLNIKDEFKIGSVIINRNDSNDYKNVEGWKIVYRKDF